MKTVYSILESDQNMEGYPLIQIMEDEAGYSHVAVKGRIVRVGPDKEAAKERVAWLNQIMNPSMDESDIAKIIASSFKAQSRDELIAFHKEEDNSFVFCVKFVAQVPSINESSKESMHDELTGMAVDFANDHGLEYEVA